MVFDGVLRGFQNKVKTAKKRILPQLLPQHFNIFYYICI